MFAPRKDIGINHLGSHVKMEKKLLVLLTASLMAANGVHSHKNAMEEVGMCVDNGKLS